MTHSFDALSQHTVSLGGLKHKTLSYSTVSSQVNCSLLALGVMGVLFPTILTWTNAETLKGEVNFSRAASILLFLTYVAFLYFQIVTHPHAYDEVVVEKEDEEEKNNGISDHELLVHEVSLLRAALEGKLKNRQSSQPGEINTPDQYNLVRHALSTHTVNTLCQHTLSIHPINTPFQHSYTLY